MNNRRKEIGNLSAAVLIGCALLYALIGPAAPAIAEETRTLIDGAGNGAADGAVIDPAKAFPADTLFYLELFRPVHTLDRLSRMSFWPQAVSLSDGISDFMCGRDGSCPFLSHALETWDEGSELRSGLQAFAGERMVVGLVPGPGGTVPVFAFKGTKGDAPANPVPSLAWIVSRFDGAFLSESEPGHDEELFSIRSWDGKILFTGCEAEGWLILSPPSGIDALNAAASVFDNRPLPESLAEREGFQKVMSSFPPFTGVRVYMNCPRLAKEIESCGMLSATGKRLAKTCLGWMGAVGITRDVGRKGIRTWMTGQILEDEVEEAVPGLLESLSPIEGPLSLWFPENALLTYEAGAPPEMILDSMGFLLKTAAPRCGRKMESLAQDFSGATGLDPAVDLFPHLGRSLAAAWLPAEDEGSSWPFPRTVVLARVTDKEKVKTFISRFVEWDAGAWAPFTGGVISGMAISDRHENVELMGVDLDSVISLPLPSPTFALAGDFLIASSVRSGVTETITAVHGNGRALSYETVSDAGPIQSRAVELVHLNLDSWEREWDKCGKIALSGCGLFFLDGELLSALDPDMERLSRLGRALFGILSSFDRATGSTVLDEDGRFTFFIEVRQQ